MHTTIITTITTRVDLETFTPDHSVDINAEDALPEAAVKALAIGACRAALKALDATDPLREALTERDAEHEGGEGA